MRLQHPLTATLLGLLAVGCATNHEARLQPQEQSTQRGRFLLSAPNDVPGSFYELGVYVVGKGDTLDSIARQFQVPSGDIVAVNPGLNSKRLVIGQRLRAYERRRE